MAGVIKKLAKLKPIGEDVCLAYQLIHKLNLPHLYQIT